MASLAECDAMHLMQCARSGTWWSGIPYNIVDCRCSGVPCGSRQCTYSGMDCTISTVEWTCVCVPCTYGGMALHLSSTECTRIGVERMCNDVECTCGGLEWWWAISAKHGRVPQSHHANRMLQKAVIWH